MEKKNQDENIDMEWKQPPPPPSSGVKMPWADILFMGKTVGRKIPKYADIIMLYI